MAPPQPPTLMTARHRLGLDRPCGARTVALKTGSERPIGAAAVVEGPAEPEETTGSAATVVIPEVAEADAADVVLELLEGLPF